jgi:hypothetical protein
MGGFDTYKQPANFFRRIVSNKYPRREPRRLVEEAFAAAQQGRSAGALDARNQLLQARALLSGRVSSDDARLASIVQAEPLYDSALQSLSGAGAGSVPAQPLPPPSQLSEDDQRNRERLLRLLGLVDAKIASANKGEGGNLLVLPDDHSLEVPALQGRALGIRRKLNGALDGAALGDIEKAELELLNADADRLTEFVKSAQQAVATLSRVKLLAETAAEKVPPEMLAHSELARLLDQATAVIGSKLINAGGVKALAESLGAEIKAVQADPVKYGEQAKTKAESEQALKEARRKADAATAANLERLRLIAEPLGSGLYTEWASKVAFLKTKQLPTMLGRPAQEIDSDIKDYEDGITDAIGQATRIAEGQKALVESTKSAMQRHIDSDPVKNTRSNPAFAADWKAIDGLQQAIAGLMPASGAAMEGETLANLIAAKTLINKVAVHVDSIKSEAGAANFNTDLAAFESDLKANTGTKTALATYNAAGVTKLKEDFDKFKALQPTLPATEIIRRLADLRKRFNDSKVAAEEVKSYVDGIKAECDKFNSYGTAAKDAVGKDELSCFKPALDALERALTAKPASKAEIEAAFKAVQTAFASITSADDAKSKALAEKGGLEQQQLNNEKLKEDLEHRGEVLGTRLKDVAKKVVEAVEGDKNGPAAIERLISQAQAQVKGDDLTTAKKTLDRAEQQIDLLYADPTGGLARKRKELPNVQAEWTATRQFAHDGLTGLLGKLTEYTTTKPDGNVDKLAGRVRGYMAIFADGEDPLRQPVADLANPKATEERRRDAREEALAAIGDLQRKLQAHPLTAALVTAPMPEVRVVPRRLLEKLDWLKYNVATAVR